MNGSNRIGKQLAALVTPRADISARTDKALFVLSLLVIVIGYSLLAYRPENTLFPHWGEMWVGLGELLKDPASGDNVLWKDTIASGSRLIPSVAFAAVVGTVLGLYMGVYHGVNSLLGRIFNFLGNIPPNAIMIAFLAMFGLGYMKYTSVIVFGILPMIAISVYLAAKQVHNEYIYSAKMLGASNQEIVWSIMFKQVLPHIISAIKQSIGPAVIFLIATEWVTGESGVGFRFYTMSRTVKLERIFPYVMYLGLLGLMGQIFFNYLTGLLCPWYVKENGR